MFVFSSEKKSFGSTDSFAYYFGIFDLLLDSAIESAIASEGSESDSESESESESLSSKIPGVNPAFIFIWLGQFPFVCCC